jgi:putative PIN family toxin of toxin-antitoxin system
VGHTIKKITVDTNVLISFFVYPSGIVREIIGHALEHSIEIHLSTTILEEYGRVLAQKFGWNEQEIIENIGVIKKMAIVLSVKARILAVKADPTDNKVIECAVESGSDAIVSVDKHLLELKKHKSIPIFKPADVLRELLEK